MSAMPSPAAGEERRSTRAGRRGSRGTVAVPLRHGRAAASCCTAASAASREQRFGASLRHHGAEQQRAGRVRLQPADQPRSARAVRFRRAADVSFQRFARCAVVPGEQAAAASSTTSSRAEPVRFLRSRRWCREPVRLWFCASGRAGRSSVTVRRWSARSRHVDAAASAGQGAVSTASSEIVSATSAAASHGREVPHVRQGDARSLRSSARRVRRLPQQGR